MVMVVYISLYQSLIYDPIFHDDFKGWGGIGSASSSSNRFQLFSFHPMCKNGISPEQFRNRSEPFGIVYQIWEKMEIVRNRPNRLRLSMLPTVGNRLDRF